MIINLTQHHATPDQIAAGVIDLPDEERATLSKALTFDECPTVEDVVQRARAIAELAASVAEQIGAGRAMIGGAPYLMSALESSLLDAGIQPVYAFSVRESREERQADGSVRKVNVFRHGGFVEVS